MEHAASAAERLQLMTFRVQGQELGVDILAVREIRAWARPSPIPHMPVHVSGVISLRGQVLPIVDLASRLGWPPTEPTETHVVMVLSVGGEMQGVVVDGVSGIVTVDAADVKVPHDAQHNPGQRVIKGIITTDDQMITVLDLDRLPRDSRSFQLEVAA